MTEVRDFLERMFALHGRLRPSPDIFITVKDAEDGTDAFEILIGDISVATLSFQNRWGVEANHKKWLLQVYAREFVPYLRLVADSLAENFDVDIHVRLEAERRPYQ